MLYGCGALRVRLKNVNRQAALGICLGLLGNRNRNIELHDERARVGSAAATDNVAASACALGDRRRNLLALGSRIGNPADNLAQRV